MVEITPLQSFKNSLIESRAALEKLLGNDVDKFIQIAGNFVEQSKDRDKILNATRPTLFAAINKAAQCRLYIDGQEASLVVFKDTVTMMTGYKGILKMVRNSGELSSINAGVVYEKDTFEYYVDEKGEHITHKPAFTEDRGKPTMTYCIARTKGTDEPYVEVMTEKEVDACKKQSAAVKYGGDTPWNGPFADEMRKKTVLRRISKRLPMSTDLNMAIHADDDLFNAPTAEAAGPEKEEKTTSSKLEKAVSDAPKTATTGARMASEAPKAAEPAPASDKPAVTKAAEAGGDLTRYTVEGMIVDLKVVNYPAVGEQKAVTRHACKIGELWYGTASLAIYQKMTAAADAKLPVKLTFAKMLNTAKKIFHEVYEVETLAPTFEDTPI